MFTLRKILISGSLLLTIASAQPIIAMDKTALIGAAASVASIPAGLAIINKFNKNPRGYNWLKGAMVGAAGSSAMIFLSSALTGKKIQNPLFPILKATIGSGLIGSLRDYPVLLPVFVVPGTGLIGWAIGEIRDTYERA